MYDRCSALERLELWEVLEGITEQNNLLWVVGGYFNIVVKEFEKLWRLPFAQQEIDNFVYCMNACPFNELKFIGNY